MVHPRSHYKVDATNPRAKAVCDRCGQIWQLSELLWQYEWTGPRLQNLRIFVCPPCLDKPQPQLKLIIIPPDPVPVYNPRPEQYVSDNNPLSGLGADPNFFIQTNGSRIGSLQGGGGLNAAFDGNPVKPSWLSAATRGTLDSSYASFVGINWALNYAPNATLPSSLQSPQMTHSLSSCTVYAPTDRSFLDSHPTTFLVQYSVVGSSFYSAWNTIGTGTTTGTAGESVGITLSANPRAQYHRVAFLGNGTDWISVAQVKFSVNERGGAGEQ